MYTFIYFSLTKEELNMKRKIYVYEGVSALMTENTLMTNRTDIAAVYRVRKREEV